MKTVSQFTHSLDLAEKDLRSTLTNTFKKTGLKKKKDSIFKEFKENMMKIIQIGNNKEIDPTKIEQKF